MFENVPADEIHGGASPTLFRPERAEDRPIIDPPQADVILGFKDQFTEIPPTPTHNGGWEKLPDLF